MNRLAHKNISRFLVIILIGVIISLQQCDVDPLRQAINDFNVIVELPAMKTIVTTQVVDIRTMEPIEQPVTLTFQGPDAGNIIDTYSEPISGINIEKGIASFGIDSTISPSQDNPVQFTASVKAKGYYKAAKKVTIVKNDAQLVITLTPNQPITDIVGTEGIRDQSAETDQNGLLKNELHLVIPEIEESNTNSWFHVEKGAIPMTSDRKPLKGKLTTKIRTFDSNNGQKALADRFLTAQNGVRRSLFGAIHLTVTDENGNVAAGFNTDSVAESTQNSISASLFEDNKDRNAGTETGLGTGLGIGGGIGVATGVAIGAVVIGVTAIEGGNDHTTPTTTTIEGNDTTFTIAVDTVYEDIDTNEGLMYVFYMQGDAVAPKVLLSQITITSNKAATLINPRLAGWGLNIAGNDFNIPAGDTTIILKDLLGIGNQTVDIIESSKVHYGFYAEDESGKLVSVEIADPSTGSYSLELSDPPNTRNYHLRASVSSPEGKKFDPQISGSSLDGLCLLYKPTGSERTYKQVPSSWISSDITPTSVAIYTNTPVTLLENVSYSFKAVFDSKSSSAAYTTPAGKDSINIAVDPEVLGLEFTDL